MSEMTFALNNLNAKMIGFLVTILLTSLFNAKAQNNNTYGKPNPCFCSTIKDLTESDWVLSAVGDSVVICKKGKISTEKKSYSNYVDFLKENSLAQGNEKIVFCQTGKVVPSNGFGNYSLSYAKKQFVITWNLEVDSFLVNKNKWASELGKGPYVRMLYRQNVYALANKLALRPVNLVFQAHKIPAVAVNSVNELYLQQKKRSNSQGLYFLAKRLFILAMSGNKLSQTRFLNLKNEFQFQDDTWLIRYQGILKDKLSKK